MFCHSVQLSVYLQVFEAEKMTGKYGIYHQKCFKCSKCKRPLDYGSLAEGPDNQLYCKNCYAVEHGHKSKPNLHDADVTLLQVMRARIKF